MYCIASLDVIMLGAYDSQINVSSTDPYISCTLVRHGLMPSAPGKPSVAITIKALELFRLTHLRCPQLSISAFVKALSDIHSVGFYIHSDRLPHSLPNRFNSKNTLRPSFRLRLMFTSLYVLRLTNASRWPSAASLETGVSAIPALPVHTNYVTKSTSSFPCYGPWMVMTH